MQNKKKAPAAEKKAPAAEKSDSGKTSDSSGAMAQDASMSLRKAAVQRWIADYRSRSTTSESSTVGKAETQSSAPSEEDIAANKSAVQVR